MFCDYDHSQNRLWSSVGPKRIVEMAVALALLSDDCIARMKNNEDMKMTADEIKSFNSVTCCYICDVPLKQNYIKRKDHDHQPGPYRGSAHQK